MLSVTVLGSGSRGNALLIEGVDTTILIDAGLPPRTLLQRLLAARKRPEQVQALVLTHEHTDHASGAAAAQATWHWPVHATAGTLGALPELSAAAVGVAANVAFDVGGLSLVAVPVPHDAREAVALVITDRRTGCRIGIATDLGHVPDSLPPHFERLDMLIVESNHDERMLADGPYPASLKQRIRGRLGHLSNRQAADFAATCAHKGLRGVVLAHLSETNNVPDAAVAAATTALRKAGWRGETVWAAHQRQVRGPYAATPGGAPVRAIQLGLDL